MGTYIGTAFQGGTIYFHGKKWVRFTQFPRRWNAHISQQYPEDNFRVSLSRKVSPLETGRFLFPFDFQWGNLHPQFHYLKRSIYLKQKLEISNLESLEIRRLRFEQDFPTFLISNAHDDIA